MARLGPPQLVLQNGKGRLTTVFKPHEDQQDANVPWGI